MASSVKKLYCKCKDHKILLYNGSKNYNFWKKNMEVIFRKRSLFCVLEARNIRSVRTREFKKKNKECILLIIRHIADCITGFIINKTMAYDMWHFLLAYKNKLDPFLEYVGLLDYEGLEESLGDEDDICPDVLEDYEVDSWPQEPYPYRDSLSFDSDYSD